MNYRKGVLRVGVVAVLVLLQLGWLVNRPVAADVAGGGLVFREVKITDDEFVVLTNTSGTSVQLSNYWLGYVSDDTASATAPPVQQLPDRSLAAGGVLLLSGGGVVDVCDANLVAELSPSLSDTKGTLALWQQTGGNFTELTGAQTQVRWGKSTSTTKLPDGEIDLKSETTQYGDPVWYFDASSSQWKLADYHSCGLTVYSTATDTTGTVAQAWLSGSGAEPPATILSIAAEVASKSGKPAPALPIGDIGLAAPRITELLPNPMGTGTDGTDEFIELYNSNPTTFDLSGFMLQTGATTKHKYTFPAGTKISAKSFRAFYSSDTGLSLSNSGGQGALLDPFGKVISQTDVYGTAKDGQAWALANGSWYWTNQPTPGKTNVIMQSGNAAAVTGAKSASKAHSAVQGASTVNNAALSGSAGTTAAQVAPIHPWTLAIVALLALAYGLYEYRADVANHLHQFRKHREARAGSR